MSHLLNTIWFGPLVWAMLFIADYYVTIASARLYKAGACEKIVFQGSFELTPYFQKDVDALRMVSPRFLRALFLMEGLLLLTCLLARLGDVQELYRFLLGGVILLQLAIHHRHFRNLFFFRALAGTDVRGRIEYSRQLTLRLSSVDLIMFAALYAVVALFTQSLFVSGGAVTCAFTAVKHLRLSRQRISAAAA